MGRIVISICWSFCPMAFLRRRLSSFAVAEPLIACGLAYDVVPCSWSDFLAERDGPAW